MARSLYILALLSSVVAAQSSSVGNLEAFPSISNDLSNVNTASLLAGIPTGTVEPVYGTGSAAAAAPTYPASTGGSSYGTAAPVAVSSGGSSGLPYPTETGGPVYGASSAAPVATTVQSSYVAPSASAAAAGNATATQSAIPAASSFVSSGNAFTVKLPIVLGALGLVFAML